MRWLASRLMQALAWIGVGALLGWLAGRALGSVPAGSVIGSTAGLGAWLAIDGLRASRLLRWLLTGTDRAPPRDLGLWGELAYRAERAIRQREQDRVAAEQRHRQFLAGIDASPNGVLLLDRVDGIDWCNRVAADCLEIDDRRDHGQAITHLVRAPEFVAFLRRGDWTAPVVFPAPDGKTTLSVQLRRFGDGQKLVLLQDITEHQRIDQMRRDFVANVSHEIRTPLTVLAGFLETMSSLSLSEVERQHVLRLMQQQSARMQVLVADLLTLARLEGSPRPPVDRWVDLSSLVRRAVGDGHALSSGRHVLSVTESPSAIEVAGDEDELFSAVANLVNNAVRYTPAGGRVELVASTRGDGSAEIAVRDSGIGIPREHLPRLTERFYRVDGSRSRESGGTGLGLSIVKHVIQRHAGELVIESEPGKGSSFRLTLPPWRVRTPGTAPHSGADEAA